MPCNLCIAFVAFIGIPAWLFMAAVVMGVGMTPGRRGWLFLALMAAVLVGVLLHSKAGRADTLPHGVTCSDIRAHVALHGERAALVWAIRQGYSWREIREARKCLR